MRNSLLITSCALLFSVLFLWAFHSPEKGKEYGEAPGRIECIGDAGSPNVLHFERWMFTKAEMKDGKVENLKLEADIDTQSLTGDWTDLVNSIKKKKDYFYVSKFPNALVKIEGAKLQEDGNYATDARLTLKGKSRTVPLTFAIGEEKPYHVVGDGVIQRKQFGFTGKGPKWEVPVHFDLYLPVE